MSGNTFPVVREGTLHGFRFKRDDKVKDDSKRNYSFDLELCGDKEYLSRFDSSDINKTVFFTREEAEQKASAINESMARKKSENSNKFKITKNKPYRVNFSYQGKHYSVQELGDTYEQYVALTCKENKDFCVCLKEEHMPSLIPCMQIGQTYRDTDLSGVQKLIDDYIDPYLNDKSELAEEVER